MNVIINNLLTNYEVQGKGPVILFLHGWGDDLRTFSQLITKLKNNYTCVSVDLPGFGATQQPNEVWGVEEYATFTKNFVKKIKIEPAIIVGHSNGGTIALFALSHNLLEPQKLILFASAGIRSEDGFRKTILKVIAKTGKVFTKALPKKTQASLRQKLYKNIGSDLLVSPHLEETFKKVVSYDIQADASKVSQKTLLLYAEDDSATPPHYGEILRSAIKQSQLIVLPEGGHFIHQTQLNSIMGKIEEFTK
jgi:pimeloyl-ACP methyl ester carboxylesterase